MRSTEENDAPEKVVKVSIPLGVRVIVYIGLTVAALLYIRHIDYEPVISKEFAEFAARRAAAQDAIFRCGWTAVGIARPLACLDAQKQVDALQRAASNPIEENAAYVVFKELLDAKYPKK